MSGIFDKDSLTGEEIQVLAMAILLELNKAGDLKGSADAGGRKAPAGHSWGEREDFYSQAYEVLKRPRKEETLASRTVFQAEAGEQGGMLRAVSGEALPGSHAGAVPRDEWASAASALPDGGQEPAGGRRLEESGLPERLSELFSRDARRYDSPFERY